MTQECRIASVTCAILAKVRAKLDRQRSIWLRGHRDAMGFAYLTLGVPRP
jgi:hypothetical protein